VDHLPDLRRMKRDFSTRALINESIWRKENMSVIASPSSCQGMGAVVSGNTISFRVWAPFAAKVAVAGTFNGWSNSTHCLASENNGYWSGEFSDPKVGDKYRFIIVNRNTGFEYRRNDPYAKQVTHSVGDSVITSTIFDWENDDDFQISNWNELVIYEMHIGTFNDTPGGMPGNLDTAIDRLDYLKDLGINAVKVMPLTEFAADYSWGYNPAHIFAVESAYGGPKALKQFIKAAHEREIAVIIDVVYNHFGPSDLDLWRFDGWSRNGKGGIYFYNDWRSKTPWGDTRPDYGRAEVRQFIRDNALMWLMDFHADGLRWDSTVNIRTKENGGGGEIADGWHLMRWINDEINFRFPGKISIAEDLQNNEWISKETHEGGAGFDVQWAANFVHPVRQCIIESNDAYRNMYAIRDALYARYNHDVFERIVYTESHDEVANGHARVPEEIWAGNAESWFSRKRSTLGAVLVLTSPGIPMIFQGQEILEDEWFRDTDPIDWSKLHRHGGIHHMYRDLIRLRRNWHNQTRGLSGQHVNVYHVNNNDKLIAYHRWTNGGPGDDVVVILNMANRSYGSYSLGLPRKGLWEVRFNSDWTGYSDDFSDYPGYDTVAYSGSKDDMRYNANIGIGPYSALILSQDGY